MTLSGKVIAREHLGGETLYYLQTRYGRVTVKGEHFWDDTSETAEVYFGEADLMFFDREGNRTQKRPDILSAFAHEYSRAI